MPAGSQVTELGDDSAASAVRYYMFNYSPLMQILLCSLTIKGLVVDILDASIIDSLVRRFHSELLALHICLTNESVCTQCFDAGNRKSHNKKQNKNKTKQKQDLLSRDAVVAAATAAVDGGMGLNLRLPKNSRNKKRKTSKKRGGGGSGGGGGGGGGASGDEDLGDGVNTW